VHAPRKHLVVVGGDVGGEGVPGRLVAREGPVVDVLVAAVGLSDCVAQGDYGGEEDSQPLDPDEDAQGAEFMAPLGHVRVVARNPATAQRHAVPAGSGESVEGQPKDTQD